MKNSHLPLIQALKNRMKPKEEGPSFEAPRRFEVLHSEVPGLPGRKVGEAISVNMKGHIQSQSADGHAVVHVSSVSPDSDEMTKKENPDASDGPKELRVGTQESHVP